MPDDNAQPRNFKMTTTLDTTTEAYILPHNQQSAAMWSAGGEKYDRISRQIADAIEHCVDRLDPQPHEKILDVATGTGWTARRVQSRGAVVTGVDLGEDVIRAARRLDPRDELQLLPHQGSHGAVRVLPLVPAAAR